MYFPLAAKEAHTLLKEKSNLAYICCKLTAELHLKTGQFLVFKYYRGCLLLGPCLLFEETFYSNLLVNDVQC